jgi:hypothetical protein
VKRTIVIGASLLATLAVAAPANAGVNAKNVAAKACAADKKTDKQAFEGTWGPEHAMRNCIKATVPEVKNAAKECKAERELDPIGFLEHGTNENGRNAFGKCVSELVRADDEEPTPT